MGATPLGQVGFPTTVHDGLLHVLTPPTKLQVHWSCAPGSTVVDPSVSVIIPEVLQSGPAPHDTNPAPSAAQVGVPAKQVGTLPVQKSGFGGAPEIYKNDEH